MRYALFLPGALILLVIAACGDDNGGSSSLSDELADVCTETDSADTDRIEVSSPEADDEVSSPLVVIGEIDTAEQEFWISAVEADGDHFIDYPARSRDFVEGELSAFEISVPFTVGEETPMCVWVYRENLGEEEAIRIPVTFVPTESPEATP